MHGSPAGPSTAGPDPARCGLGKGKEGFTAPAGSKETAAGWARTAMKLFTSLFVCLICSAGETCLKKKDQGVPMGAERKLRFSDQFRVSQRESFWKEANVRHGEDAIHNGEVQ